MTKNFNDYQLVECIMSFSNQKEPEVGTRYGLDLSSIYIDDGDAYGIIYAIGSHDEIYSIGYKSLSQFTTVI